MDKNFKPWLKHRYIKTMYDSYVRIPENASDLLEFMVDSVPYGNDFVHDVVMVDSKERRTWLTDIGAVSNVLPVLVLDELMRFITEEDDSIIDMYVVYELALRGYDSRTDLPI